MKREDPARGKKYALQTKPTDPSSPFIKVTYVGLARSRAASHPVRRRQAR